MFPMRMGRNNGYPGQDLLKQLDFYSDKNGTRTLQIVKLCPFPTDLCIDKQVSVDWNDWNAVCFGRKVNESTPSPLPSPPVKSNISSSKRIHRLVPMKKKRITSPTQVMWRKGKAMSGALFFPGLHSLCFLCFILLTASSPRWVHRNAQHWFSVKCFWRGSPLGRGGGGVTVSRKKVRKLTHNHSMLPWVRRGMSLSPVWSMSACYCPPYKVSGSPFFSHYYPPSSQALTVPGAKEHTTRLGLGGSRDVEVMLFRLHFCLNDHKSGVHLWSSSCWTKRES